RNIVASSAAALVSDRAYRPAPFPQSTTIFKKITENRKWLFPEGKSRQSEKPRKIATKNGSRRSLPAFRRDAAVYG
ncbi:hypothetical protein, partial [Ensifer aridi]|uniref:hypothetical protein n=1 Tax=Ensifer aridi TaxID=1708715 RepID=UPI001969E6EF